MVINSVSSKQQNPNQFEPFYMRKLLLISALVLFWSATVFGQTRVISGQVLSDEDNGALPGANVLVQGTTKGTVTDLNGRYTLELGPGEDVLVFSFIGFTTQTVQVGERNTINVTLAVDRQALEEIVVIGYGSVKKSDLTGSVASISGNDLTKIPNPNPLQALQGKVPGVQVTTGSGAPGANPTLRIRGIGTINDASPLFVVDGVIIDNGNVNFLSPSDIQSINVLKDASAIAIFGTRGSNGVVIITTNKGSDKGRINLSTSYGVQSVAHKIDLLNAREFAQVINSITPGTYNNLDALPDIDWQDLIYRKNQPIANYDLSFANSSDKLSYYLGTSIFTQDGLIEKSEFTRFTLKLNTTYKALDFLTLGNNLTISRTETGNAPGVISTAYRAWPVSNPFNPDGSFAEVGGGSNPLASINYANSSSQQVRLLGNLYAEATLLKGLTLKSSYQADLTVGRGTSFTPAFFVSALQQNEFSDLSKSSSLDGTWLWENTITYDKTFGNHRVNLLGGFSVQETYRESLSGTTQNLIRDNPDLWYLNNGENSTTLPNTVSNDLGASYSYGSYLFRANYVNNDKYLLTLTGRIDGSSKFGENNVYGFFPAVAVGWNISQEDFMAGIGWLANLKLRGSWGNVGNDKISFESRFARIQTGLEAVFGANETLFPGATLDKTSNPDLKWEITRMLDIGVEFGLFNNRLQTEIDYYNNQTNDVLNGIPTPGHLGNGAFTTVVQNVATVANRGVEFNLSWRDNVGEIGYQVGVLGHTVKNEVISMGVATGTGSVVTSGSLGNGQLVTRTEKGQPIGYYYGYQVVGVIQNTTELNTLPRLPGQQVGDLRYADVNGDGTISALDRTFIGSPIPDFVFGFNGNVTYKGFEFSADFQGQMGNEIYNGKMAVRPNLYNYEARVKNRWTGDGTSSNEPRATTGGINFEPSTYFIEDGSYLRLRSVSIGYNIPKNIISKAMISNARVYISGTNVFTLTNYSGYSPEVGGSAIASGIDLGIYPISRIYTMGLNVTF